MAQGFYVTVIRDSAKGRRTGWLLGPYNSKAEAEGHVQRARRVAEQIDPRTVFDGFGVTMLERDGALPPGTLNSLIELEGEIGL